MSIKRTATTNLNHENWDQEDPSEQEEMGSFKTASKDVLERRVIRTAKRRSQASGDEPKKSVFSGFGGFNKAPPSSFDFLANLTNGNKTTNGTLVSKSDTGATSSPFGTKQNPTSSDIFNTPVSSSYPTKTTFGVATSQTSSLFGGSTTNATATSLFSASKTETKVEGSPFKIQATSRLANTSDTEAATSSTNTSSNLLISPTAPTIFGGASTNTNKSLFSTTFSSTPFKMQSGLSTSTVQTNFNITKSDTNTPITEKKEVKDDKKLTYYSKLKGLNECVSDWIKKHVEETPLCILSPIFEDYEKYLTEIQQEYHGKDGESKKTSENTTPEKKLSTVPLPKTMTAFNNSGSTLFTTSPTLNSKPSIFTNQNTAPASEKASGFTFGISTTNSPSSAAPTITTTGGGFSFGTTTPFTQPPVTNSNGAAQFSFGIGKPFSFSPNVQKNVEQATETTEEEDEPPKVDFTPVVEENCVFDKRCKIFVKKDGNFVDKGVGTLYIKKIEESDKHQLLVRANTNLGNVLLNLILTSGIPTQRLGKNNVMMVCIPTPEAKPPPTPILIRVKTSDEADALLATLDKYKV